MFEVSYVFLPMLIFLNIIVNADDLGLNNNINQAILLCFQKGYVNSTSFITNIGNFEETVCLIKENLFIHNIGVHINLAEGRSVSNFTEYDYLNYEGDWNI